jgi:2-polyprenyl-3-methyl-5-hydroxy-6-metoxy-1,4-benzoquinol methylase
MKKNQSKINKSEKIIGPKQFNKVYFTTGNYKEYEKIASAWTKRVARRIIKETVPGKLASVLDVGCAQGFLVSMLRRMGCKAFGLEYSDYALSQAKPDVIRYIKKGSILSSRAALAKFNVVVCFNVLEYIPEPLVLKALKNLVNWSNDMVFFTTCFTHSCYATQKHSPDNLRITVKTQKEWIKLFGSLGARYSGKFYDGGGGDVLIFKIKQRKK